MGRIPSVVHYGPFSIEEAAVQRPPGFGGWIPDGWTFLSNSNGPDEASPLLGCSPTVPVRHRFCVTDVKEIKTTLFLNNCPIRQSGAGPEWEPGYRERPDPQPQWMFSWSGLMNGSVLWTGGRLPPTRAAVTLQDQRPDVSDVGSDRPEATMICRHHDVDRWSICYLWQCEERGRPRLLLAGDVH